jgi:hypothetical protein
MAAADISRITMGSRRQRAPVLVAGHAITHAARADGMPYELQVEVTWWQRPVEHFIKAGQ